MSQTLETKKTRGEIKKLRKGNKSGITGVFPIWRKGVEYWVARLGVDGGRKQFSTKKFPNGEAKRLAIAERKRFEMMQFFSQSSSSQEEEEETSSIKEEFSLGIMDHLLSEEMETEEETYEPTSY